MSFQAPSQTLLLLSIAFVCIIGAIAHLTFWLVPPHDRDLFVKIRRLTLRQRLRWRNQKWELLIGSWGFLILPFAIWCFFTQVFPMAALMALCAVLLSYVPPWVTMGWENARDRLSNESTLASRDLNHL